MAVQQNRKMQTKICSREAILLDSGFPVQHRIRPWNMFDMTFTSHSSENARHIVIAVEFCFLQFVCRYFTLRRVQSLKLSHVMTRTHLQSHVYSSLSLPRSSSSLFSFGRFLLCRITFRAELQLICPIRHWRCLFVTRGKWEVEHTRYY